MPAEIPAEVLEARRKLKERMGDSGVRFVTFVLCD